MHKQRWRQIWQPALLALFWGGCGELGKVNQGRVVAYDREKGMVTLIADSNPANPAEPCYDALPPVLVKVPVRPSDMGPAPEPGRLLDIDFGRSELRVFDADTQTVRAIPFKLVDRRTKVSPDDPRVAGGKLPTVDRNRKTITIYRRKQRELLTFSVADSELGLPEVTWRLGDEVRYYYKHPGRALRMMNVTKTDIF